MLESTRIKTEIPGPKSRALMERRHRAVSSGVGIATPMFAKEAKGALLTDVDGNTFIDFGGGIGVMNVGHTNARVVEAVREQAERLTHSCFYVTEYEQYIELAERLNALIPGDSEKRSFFVNSGGRGGRERCQDRALLHGASGGDRLRELLPRPHDVRDDAHGQDRPVQEGLRAVRPRGLQGAIALRLPLPCGQGLLGRLPGRLLRGHREGVREHGSPEQRRGDHRRAGQWGGRLHTFPRLLPEATARAVRRARYPDDRGRGPDGLWPHGQDVRHRALRGRAGHRHDGQEHGRRVSP